MRKNYFKLAMFTGENCLKLAVFTEEKWFKTSCVYRRKNV